MTILAVMLVFFLFYLVQQQIYARYWAKNLTITLDFSHKELHQGESVTLVSTLSNRKNLPLPLLTLRYRLPDALSYEGETAAPSGEMRLHSNLFSLGLYQRLVRRQTLLCRQRGYFSLSYVETIAGDIFMAGRLTGQYPIHSELLVFPSLIPYPDLHHVLRRIGGDVEMRQFLQPDPMAFRGIREYAPLDDMRHINWVATAKMGELMVNTYNTTATGTLCILLNCESCGNYTHPELWEESIRLAASVARHFCHEGISVLLVSNGRDSVTQAPVRIPAGSGNGHTMTILRALARIKLSLSPDPMADILAAIKDPDPLYLLISANDGEPLREGFFDLRERGLGIRWLHPILWQSGDKTIPDPDIIEWEVERHAPATDATA